MRDMLVRRTILKSPAGESSCCLQEHAHDGSDTFTSTNSGEWVPQHLTGDIRSGIGIALQAPRPNHWTSTPSGNELVLTAWDDDNDGLPSWKDYCPYAFGLSTDETRQDAQMQMGMASKGIKVEGTEDAGTTMTSACLPWGPLSTLCMVVGLPQCFFRDGVSTKRTFEFR